ncbi:MAG: RNA 2',3'-cyclic phosphodiesterase [Thermoguttaceae bacterium]|jgi:2'-5' RNA ligase
MASSIRTFVAVETGEAVRRRAAELMDALRAGPLGTAPADVKWVERQNLHITLKFLGDVAEPDLPGVCEAVRQAAAGLPPFDLEIRAAGAFPHPGRPRTLWLGAGDGGEAMAALAAAIEKALHKLGYPKEGRRFETHLTIGRVRGGSAPALAELGRLLRQHAAFDAGRFHVAEVVTFASHLGPKGPTYDALSRAPLGGGPS